MTSVEQKQSYSEIPSYGHFQKITTTYRPFIHEILNEAFGEGNNQSNAVEELAEREPSWLEWSILESGMVRKDASPPW